ncbi:MAG: FAD-dependent oxidoreductase [Pseudomonadota bacterium]
MSVREKRIAVVGGGVSGITVAHLLDPGHRVTLYEKNDYVGGHTHTIAIPNGPDAGTAVDTGFIVFNDRTYPNFQKLLGRLGATALKSDMSFSYFDERSGYQYASRNLDGLFAQRRNLLNTAHLRMIGDILRFNRLVRRQMQDGLLGDRTLGAFLQQYRFGDAFRQRYVLPMVSAIWSAPHDTAGDFPMQTFARFFNNHGLLTIRDQPQWYVVEGGSSAYVDAFCRGFGGEIHTSSPIKAISRDAEGATVTLSDGTRRRHDHVVIATHADEALALLADPSTEERRWLGPWQYSRNQVVVHTDAAWMPSNPRAWASWNYLRKPGASSDPVVLTYHMNRLQRLKTRRQYFVTLNPPEDIDPAHVIRRLVYTHPVFTFSSMVTQTHLPVLNGARHTHFCGSYFNYGFHEDAVTAGAAVAADFGATL